MKKILFVVLAVMLCFGLRAADAATLTWDNGAGNMTWDAGASTNWTGSTWANGSDAVFDATGAGAITIAGGGVSARALTFHAGGTGYSFGGGALTIANNGAITNNAAGTTVFNSAVVGPANNTTFTVSGSGDLTLGGAVGSSINGMQNPAVIMNGAGVLTLGGITNNFGCAVTANSGTVVLGKDSVLDTTCAIGTGLTIAGGTVRLGGSGGDQIWKGAGVTVNSGTFDFNGTSEAFNTLDGGGGTILNNGGSSSLMSFGSNNGGGTYSGRIADGTAALAVTKLGTGVQYVDGNNGYSGQTTVSGGYLVVRRNNALGTGAGGAVVNSGATLQLENRLGTNAIISGITATIAGHGVGGTRGALASWTGTNAWAGPVAMTADSRIYVNANRMTVDGEIGGAGWALTKGGAGVLVLGGTTANTYAGATTLTDNGKLILGKPNGVNAMGGDLVIAPASGWGTGANTGVELAGSEQIPDAAVIHFSGADYSGLRPHGYVETVAGLDCASGKGVIENNGWNQVGSAATGTIGVNVPLGASYSYNGFIRDIDGGGTASKIALTKSGSGTQNLSGGNIVYTGPTTVNGGTLGLTDTTAFGSAVAVNAGATLNTARTATGLVNRKPIMGNAVTGSGTININNAGTGIAGGWTTVNGATGSLNFSGTVNVNSGVFSRDNVQVSTINGSATVNVASGAAFGAGRGGNSTIGALNGAGDVSTLWGGANAGSISLGNGDGSGLFTGALHGNGSNGTDGTMEGGVLSLIKVGSGAQILAGTNTYGGTTLISGGTLQFGNGGPAGTLGTGAVTDNGTLAFNRSDVYAPANSIAGTGGLIQAGAGTLRLAGTTITYAGPTAVNSGTLSLQDTTAFGSASTVAAGAALNLNKTVNGFAARSKLTGRITGAGTLNVNNAAPGIGGAWVILNSATVGLTNFTGTVNVNSGVLSMDSIAGIWSGNPALNVAAGGLFAIRAQSISVDALTGNGDVMNSWNGHGAAGDTLTVGANNGSATFSGTIHGSLSYGGTDGAIDVGILNLVKAGAGTQTLTGDNSYQGATTVNNGTLTIGGSGRLGSGVYGGAIALTAAGSTLDCRTTAAQTLSGVISGSGALVQNGPGTLTLSGANTYGGATTVAGGALKLAAQSPAFLAGAALWLDASDAGTLFTDAGGTVPVAAAGDAVALWKDKSGNNNHATVAGAQTTPTYQTGVQMGKSAVRFSAVTTCGLTTPLTVASGDLSIFVVYNYRSTTSAFRRAVQGSNNWLMGPYNNAYQTFNNGWVGAPPAVVQNQFVIQEAVVAPGGTLAAYVNGASYGSRAGTYPGKLTLAASSGAGAPPYAEPLDGDIAELLVYTKSLTSAQRRGIEAYLGQKWLSGGYGMGSLAAASPVSVGPGATFGGWGSAGAVTVDAGGALEAGQPGGGNLSFSSLAFRGAGSLRACLGSAASLAVAGGVTTAGGAGSVGVMPFNLPANGVYPLLTYGSGADPYAALALAEPARNVALVDNAGSNRVDIVVNAGTHDTWTGALSGEWSRRTLADPKNWALSSGGAADFMTLDRVVFDDSAAGATNVVIGGGDVHPGGATFSNAARAYTLSGTNGVVLAPLEKTGAGALTIRNANAFVSAAVSGGTLVVANNRALSGDSGATLTLSGGRLRAEGAIALPTAVAVTGDCVLDGGAGGLALAGPANLGAGTRTLTVSNSVAFTGEFTGPAGLTKAGPGTLTLAGAGIAYTGPTTVSSGLLRFDSASTVNSAISIPAGQNVVVTNANPTVDNWVYGIGNQALSGTGTLTKDGVGWFQFQGAGIQSFQGSIVINNGILGNGMNSTVWNNGQVKVTVNSPGVLDIRTDDMAIDRLSGNGTVANTFSVGENNTLTIGGNNGSSTFAGVIRGAGLGSTVNNTSLDAGLTSLAKAGSGTFTLSGANAYKGTTTVSGGTLVVNGTHVSGAAAYSVNTGTLAGTGTIGSAVAVGGGGTLAPAGKDGTGLFAIQGDVTFAAGGIFDVDIRGAIAGQPVGGYDRLVMSAGKTFNLGTGAARLNVRAPRGTSLPFRQPLAIESGGTPSGTFQGLDEGAEVQAGEYVFTIHYDAAGAAVTLTLRRVNSGTVLIVR